MQQATPLVAHWRILAAELGRDGHWFDVSPKFEELVGQPVVLVFRLEGQLSGRDGAVLMDHIVAVAQHWRSRGVSVTAIEIDHDSATARLSTYTDFLRSLRSRLQQGLPGFHSLSITALPTWLESRELEGLLAETDEVILQVHLLLPQSRSYFDGEQAITWMTAFGKRSPKPWRVSLPAYGARLAWSEVGTVQGIESEQSSRIAAVPADELIVLPRTLADFVGAISAKPPTGLVGFVWFRLPTERDHRAWSPATWRAVISGQPLEAQLGLTLNPSEHTEGVFEVVLHNGGEIDAEYPSRIVAETSCRIGDGFDPYGIDVLDKDLVFQRNRQALLRGGEQRTIGWLRCADHVLEFHVIL